MDSSIKQTEQDEKTAFLQKALSDVEAGYSIRKAAIRNKLNHQTLSLKISERKMCLRNEVDLKYCEVTAILD